MHLVAVTDLTEAEVDLQQETAGILIEVDQEIDNTGEIHFSGRMSHAGGVQVYRSRYQSKDDEGPPTSTGNCNIEYRQRQADRSAADELHIFFRPVVFGFGPGSPAVEISLIE